jgi:plasmid stability protein
MPDLLIRNIPPELHSRLKAAAAAHRRSVTQEAIQIIANNLVPPPPPPSPLPSPIQLRRPATAEEAQRLIDEGQKNRSQPGWAKDSLRILHPVEGPAIPDSDWNMLHDDSDPLK